MRTLSGPNLEQNVTERIERQTRRASGCSPKRTGGARGPPRGVPGPQNLPWRRSPGLGPAPPPLPIPPPSRPSPPHPPGIYDTKYNFSVPERDPKAAWWSQKGIPMTPWGAKKGVQIGPARTKGGLCAQHADRGECRAPILASPGGPGDFQAPVSELSVAQRDPKCRQN